MKFTTPVSMPVTEAQYNELKPLLETMGYVVTDYTDNFISTNCDLNNRVGTIIWHMALRERNIHITDYHRELFLALAAMTDEPNGIAGEWWKCVAGFQKGFQLGNLYKAKLSHENGLLTFTDDFDKVSSRSNTCFTKATVAEIFAHFGVSERKVQAAQSYVDSQNQYPWQKEFEVLQCKNHLDAVIDRNEDGTFGESKATIAQILENNFTHIHSIRRLADNAVFTVGDKAQTELFGIIDITDFRISGDEIKIWGLNKFNATVGSFSHNCQPYKLPTLAEVFDKVKPVWYNNEGNIAKREVVYTEGDIKRHNQLSTEAQVKQIQAYMAMRVIADWANGEAGWAPKQGERMFVIGFNNGNPCSIELFPAGFWHNMDVYFKHMKYAEQAIEILKEAGLLNALKG